MTAIVSCKIEVYCDLEMKATLEFCYPREAIAYTLPFDMHIIGIPCYLMVEQRMFFLIKVMTRWYLTKLYAALFLYIDECKIW